MNCPNCGAEIGKHAKFCSNCGQKLSDVADATDVADAASILFQKIVQEANYKISVVKKAKDSQEYALIPHDQMYEFRLMCNPEITMRKFLSSDEAQMKAGDEVLVKFGPLKGMTGRLVRSSKKYYLLKEIPGIGVMLKVSRWCCVSMEEK